MADLTFVLTTEAHIDHVAANMRQADIEEIWASHRSLPKQSLTEGLKRSDETISILDGNGIPILIFGVTPICRLTGTGAPWMLGTNDAFRYRRQLVRDTRLVVDGMLEMYPRLENYVHIKNTMSVRWLKSIGFKIDDPITFPNKEQFSRFHMSKEQSIV